MESHRNVIQGGLSAMPTLQEFQAVSQMQHDALMDSIR